VWGPVAPVWKGEERFSSNLGMVKLGGRSLERGNTATTLDKIQREGVDEWRVGRVFGASSVGGAAEREKGEERGGGSGRGVPRGMGRSWGLASIGGRCPDHVPAGHDPDAARAGGASLFRQRRAER
jgi:hypothetical protein